MTYNCRYCGAVLSTRGNRSRHETRFHPDEMNLLTYHCSICEFISRRMNELEQHMRSQHPRFTYCCHTCHLELNNSHLFAQHARSVHSFPVFGNECQPTQPAQQSAFNATLQLYSLEPLRADEVTARDLEAFMKTKKGQIEELIAEKLSGGPQKFQLSAELELLKHLRKLSSDTCECRGIIKCRFFINGGKNVGGVVHF